MGGGSDDEVEGRRGGKGGRCVRAYVCLLHVVVVVWTLTWGSVLH